MLRRQKTKVYTCHQNLVRDALGLMSDRVYHWHLTLEEYALEIIHIPGFTNMVADAMSHLEHDKQINTHIIKVHVQNKALAKLLYCYIKATTEFEPFKIDVVFLPTGTICTNNGSHQEYWYNNMFCS